MLASIQAEEELSQKIELVWQNAVDDQRLSPSFRYPFHFFSRRAYVPIGKVMTKADAENKIEAISGETQMSGVRNLSRMKHKNSVSTSFPH